MSPPPYYDTSRPLKRPSARAPNRTTTVPRTAFLSRTCAWVFLSECVSPSEFYLQPTASLPSLHSLQDDLGRYVASQLSAATACLTVGTLVIVETEEGWRRGRVEAFQEKETMKVFLVDYGISEVAKAEALIPLPDHFRQRLPFQAVECRLARVMPKRVQIDLLNGEEVTSADWSDAAGDQLFEWSRDPLCDAPRGTVPVVIPGGSGS